MHSGVSLPVSGGGGGLVAKLCLTRATPWTVAYQAPLFMGFSRQEYWSGLPFSSPGDLPGSEIEPPSPALAGGFFTTKPPGKPYSTYNSLHLLIPHSHSVPPSQFPFLETTSLSTSYCF